MGIEHQPLPISFKRSRNTLDLLLVNAQSASQPAHRFWARCSMTRGFTSRLRLGSGEEGYPMEAIFFSEPQCITG